MFGANLATVHRKNVGARATNLRTTIFYMVVLYKFNNHISREWFEYRILEGPMTYYLNQVYQKRSNGFL